MGDLLKRSLLFKEKSALYTCTSQSRIVVQVLNEGENVTLNDDPNGTIIGQLGAPLCRKLGRILTTVSAYTRRERKGSLTDKGWVKRQTSEHGADHVVPFCVALAHLKPSKTALWQPNFQFSARFSVFACDHPSHHCDNNSGPPFSSCRCWLLRASLRGQSAASSLQSLGRN